MDRDLFSMFILFILLSKSPEFLVCELLIEPKREDNILEKDFAMLAGGVGVGVSLQVPIPKIIGRKGIPGLWVLGSS